MKIIKKTYIYFFIINYFEWLFKPSNDNASLTWMISKEMFREHLKNINKKKNSDEKNIDVKSNNSKSLVPYRCPICGGNGIVSGAFYNSIGGICGTSTNITASCRSCNGTGILWG